VAQKHQRIDLAIHAAGVSREGVVWKLAVEDWDFIQAVNLRGAFLLMRHTIPVMRRGAGGRIVLIGSINGSRGKFGTSAYSASKAGLLGLAKSVAREIGRFDILVNVVEPGWVRTPLTEACPRTFGRLPSQKARSEHCWSHPTLPLRCSFCAVPERGVLRDRYCVWMADSSEGHAGVASTGGAARVKPWKKHINTE
jgi:NAD(P)-dependent dehydrogenase (short-subunit alcohol dehydrogenase family)